MSEFKLNGKSLDELSASIRERSRSRRKGQLEERSELRELCIPVSYSDRDTDNILRRIFKHLIFRVNRDRESR